MPAQFYGCLFVAEKLIFWQFQHMVYKVVILTSSDNVTLRYTLISCKPVKAVNKLQNSFSEAMPIKASKIKASREILMLDK